MKKLSKRSDFDRRCKSFQVHTWLLLQSSFFAALASIIWYKARERGLHFPKSEETSVIGAGVVIGLPYGVNLGFILSAAYDRFQKVVEAVLKKDKRVFLLNRDNRFPIMLYLVLASPALLLIGITASLEYESTVAGLTSTFGVSFILALYWIVIARLQNPLKSEWIVERTPQDWIDEDIDTYFKLGEENGQRTRTPEAYRF